MRPHLRLIAAVGRGLLGVRRVVRGISRGVGHTSSRIGRSPLVASLLASVSIAVVGLSVAGLVVASAWWGGVEEAGTWQDAVSITGSVWVMTFGVPIRLAGVDYSLLPWGLMIIPGWLGHQAGRWLARVVRPSRRRSLTASVVLTTVFSSVFVAGVSVVTDIPEVQTSARRALVMAGAVTFAAVGSGMWRSSPLIRESMHRTPMVVRVIVRASFVGVAALAGMGAFVATVAVASSFGSITELLVSLNPTTFDALVLLVLSLGYVPVLVSWSVSYIVGAGVSLGPDVLISPFVPVVPATALPAFPPLAALPETAGPGSWGLPALVLVSGALVGLLVSRFAFREGPLVRLSLAFAASALAAGWVFVLLLLGAGSLGDGRLAVIGPDPGAGALLAGVGLVVGALPTSVIRARRKPRKLASVSTESPTAIVGADS